MKKILAFILTFMFFFSIPLSFKVDVFATENTESDKISTGIFLPTSYLQYYKLDNPYAIYRSSTASEEFVAISHKDSIVIYKNEKFASIDLDLEGVSVTVIQRYKNFLLFLYKSTIHSVDITGFEEENWSPNLVNTGIYSSNSFSVCDDYVIIQNSNFIEKHQIIQGDAFAINNESVAKLQQNNTSMLLLSKNEKVYFSKIGEKGIYEWYGFTSVYLDAEATSVSTLTESDDGNTLYYSCPEGVFAVNLQTRERTLIRATVEKTDESDLGNIYSPQGLCLIENNLWVVDNSINAVQDIDLTKTTETGEKEFTDFAITTNSSAVNRLTASVKDITVDKDKIYALDEGRIVVINDINSTERTYNRINLATPVNKFTVGDGYVLYSFGKTLTLRKITPSSTDENILELENSFSTTLTDTGEIMDVAFSEGTFYVISTTIYNNANHPVIYTVKVDDETPILEKFLLEGTNEGTAQQVTADVFGVVYYCTYTGGNFEFYSYDGEKVNLINTTEKESDIRNLQTDFDGKLYALYDENRVDRIEDGSLITKTLQTSPNLGNISPAKSMCLSCNSETAYFIFEGLILHSSMPEEMDITTPHTIDIPQNFNLEFNENQSFANVKDGAKLFKIDVTKLDGKYFKFLDYSEVKNEQTDYAVRSLNDKYSLLIKENVVAVARNSDVISTFTTDSEILSGFAVVEFAYYSIPVLESHYVSSKKVEKFSKVDIIGKVNFNGLEYYEVSYNGEYGYIPDTFIVDNVISEIDSASITDAYVYKKGGVTVYDSNGEEIGTLAKKTKVTVLSYGERLMIIYGEKIGFVDSECIVNDSRSDILKSIAVFISALSLFVTTIYFEKRFLLRS